MELKAENLTKLDFFPTIKNGEAASEARRKRGKPPQQHQSAPKRERVVILTKAEVKNRIYEYIKKNGSTSYAEIERVFEECGFDYTGALSSCSTVNDLVVFWHGWNLEAYTIVQELLQERKVERDACGMLIYLLDGKCLDMPVLQTAKQLNGSNREHWLPCVFNACAAPKA